MVPVARRVLEAKPGSKFQITTPFDCTEHDRKMQLGMRVGATSFRGNGDHRLRVQVGGPANSEFPRVLLPVLLGKELV